MTKCVLASVMWLAVASLAIAQTDEPPTVPAEDQAVHAELIALRERIMKAYEARDVDGVLENLHDNVVVTWQNAQVSRGHQGIRDFYNEMMKGPDSVVVDLKTKLTVDDLSRLYLDQKKAVAIGSLEDDFTLRDGTQFHLVSRWTADLVKEEDEWKIAAFHVSTDMFDNGVLRLTVQKNRLYIGAIAGVIGLIVGCVVGALVARRKTTP